MKILLRLIYKIKKPAFLSKGTQDFIKSKDVILPLKHFLRTHQYIV